MRKTPYFLLIKLRGKKVPLPPNGTILCRHEQKSWSSIQFSYDRNFRYEDQYDWYRSYNKEAENGLIATSLDNFLESRFKNNFFVLKKGF